METKIAETPDRFVCPLTLEVMKFPFRDSVSGRCYERAAILEWIWFGNATCPMSREPLHPSNFSLNEPLMLEIRGWRQEHGIPEETEEESEEGEEGEEGEMWETEDTTQEEECSTLPPKTLDALRERVFRRQQQRIKNYRARAA